MPPLLVAVGGLAMTDHWKIYLPAVLLSFVVMVPAIISPGSARAHEDGVRRRGVAADFGAGRVGRAGGRTVFGGPWLMIFCPRRLQHPRAAAAVLISRIAPPEAKGAALGVYNTARRSGCFWAVSWAGFGC
ncbi:MAG: hypothetical protein IPG52_08415 [Rhodocyclaceae bacterium]|nr:hypothetical protein [Rhodocyclaceae bacterium]